MSSFYVMDIKLLILTTVPEYCSLPTAKQSASELVEYNKQLGIDLSLEVCCCVHQENPEHGQWGSHQYCM